jgi:hypothetical protein
MAKFCPCLPLFTDCSRTGESLGLVSGETTQSVMIGWVQVLRGSIAGGIVRCQAAGQREYGWLG